jgi:hypothetical protein
LAKGPPAPALSGRCGQGQTRCLERPLVLAARAGRSLSELGIPSPNHHLPSQRTPSPRSVSDHLGQGPTQCQGRRCHDALQVLGRLALRASVSSISGGLLFSTVPLSGRRCGCRPPRAPTDQLLPQERHQRVQTIKPAPAPLIQNLLQRETPLGRSTRIRPSFLPAAQQIGMVSRTSSHAHQRSPGVRSGGEVLQAPAAHLSFANINCVPTSIAPSAKVPGTGGPRLQRRAGQDPAQPLCEALCLRSGA